MRMLILSFVKIEGGQVENVLFLILLNLELPLSKISTKYLLISIFIFIRNNLALLLMVYQLVESIWKTNCNRDNFPYVQFKKNGFEKLLIDPTLIKDIKISIINIHNHFNQIEPNLYPQPIV